MANGSFGGGQGTKESPYEIEDLWDYLAMKDKVDNSYYFKLKNDIDMNDYEDYKFEIPSNLYSNTGSVNHYLDGDNHSIKNIIMKDSVKYIFHSGGRGIGEIKNIKFENLILMNINSSDHLFRCSSFKNVHIGCFVFDSTIECLSPDCSNPQDCTFNIKGKYRNNSILYLINYSGSTTLERCHLNFDLFGNYLSLFKGHANYSSTLDNCYFTGTIKNKIVSGSGFNILEDFDLKNSYFNIDLFLPQNINNIGINSCGGTSFSFANQSKIKHFDEEEEVSGISFSPSTNFSFLTDEECKDPHGLLERGFPVVPSDT